MTCEMVIELVSGAINWDTTVFVDTFPSPGEEVRAKRIVSVPGGKGANVAVASARILGAGNVGIIGALGQDDIAEKQMEILGKDGVDTSCIKRLGTGSGQAYIVVDQKGENFILTYKAANHMITADMVNDDITLNAIKNCKFITVIDPPLEVAGALISNAKSFGKGVIWSPGMLVRHGFDNVKDMLLRTDYVIMNQSEALILTGMDDAVQASLTLSTKTNRKVIATLGKEGGVLCWDGKTAYIPALDLNVLGMEVVNTVGAGDAFVGAFTALKVKGFGDVEALFMANIAGSLKTTKEETRGSPTYSEIRNCFEDQRVQPLFSKIRVV